jgi:hypothetical protein
MATIPEIKARIHALWDKGDTRTLDESVELGRLLTDLHTAMPPGDFYTHVLDVLQFPHTPRSSSCTSTARPRGLLDTSRPSDMLDCIWQKRPSPLTSLRR